MSSRCFSWKFVGKFSIGSEMAYDQDKWGQDHFVNANMLGDFVLKAVDRMSFFQKHC